MSSVSQVAFLTPFSVGFVQRRLQLYISMHFAYHKCSLFLLILLVCNSWHWINIRFDYKSESKSVMIKLFELLNDVFFFFLCLTMTVLQKLVCADRWCAWSTGMVHAVTLVPSVHCDMNKLYSCRTTIVLQASFLCILFCYINYIHVFERIILFTKGASISNIVKLKFHYKLK